MHISPFMHKIIHHKQKLINVMIINKQYQIEITQQLHNHKHSIMLNHYNINTPLDKHNDSLTDHISRHKHCHSIYMTITQAIHQ